MYSLMYAIVTWVNGTEHKKIIDKQCRLEAEKGKIFHATGSFQTMSDEATPETALITHSN